VVCPGWWSKLTSIFTDMVRRRRKEQNNNAIEFSRLERFGVAE
jgi:hypothetical protein